MPDHDRLRRLPCLRTAVVAGLAVLTSLAGTWPASASTAGPGPQPGSAHPGRYNTAAAHSPRVARLLAGHPSGLRALPGTVTGKVQGVDVSASQHPGGAPIDWAKVAAAGYRFAFVKATEGSYYVNPYFSADVAAARKAGLFTAAYHFAIPNDSSASLQADLAVNATGPVTGGRALPLILDIEYDPYNNLDHANWCYGLSPAAMVTWLTGFVAEVQRRTGELPAIYTTAEWWARCTGGSTAFSADPLWVAPTGTSPLLPAGWTTWTYLQYTSTATVPGIQARTDASSLNPASLTAAVPATQSDATGSTATLPVHALSAAAGQSLTWSAAGLPPGLAIDPATGVIAGTLPTVPATYPVTVTVTDSKLDTGSVRFAWKVHRPVRLTWPGRQAGAAGTATSLQVKASDGLTGCSLTFSAAGLPPGLSISPCGQITGWASQPGRYQVTVRAGDTASRALATTTIRWTVLPPPLSAAGTIRLAVADACLAGRNGSTGPGLVPKIWRCGRSGGQRWTLAQNGTLHLGSSCLAAAAVTGGGTTPVLRACTDSAAELWQQADRGGLVSQATGQCLTDPDGSHASGTAVTLSGCTSRASQAWTLPAGPLAPDLHGTCAAGPPASSGVPGRVILTRCAGTASQAWTITTGRDITVSGRCLDAAQPAAAGSPVTLSACTDIRAEHWQPMPGPGGVMIVNPASGLCLIAAGPAAASPLALGFCVAGDRRAAWHTG